MKWKLHRFGGVSSTMEAAGKFAEEGAEEGTIVLAETQTSGKGRLGRKWYSPPDGLYLSLILRPKIAPASAQMITFMSAVAAAKALRRYGLDAMIKWPNDVLIDERKVCGILTEISLSLNSINYVIIGIGMNVNSEPSKDLKGTATSIKEELKKEVDREELLKRLLEELEAQYTLLLGEFHSILGEWKRLSATLRKNVRVEMQREVIEGEAVDVNENGLILKLQDGSFRTIIAGDCIHIR